MTRRLIFIATSIVIMSFLMLNVCRADDIDDTIFTNAKFQVKETFNITDGIRVTVHAKRSIDIYRLIENVNYDDSESMDSVKLKIDAKRKALFPNEEIIVAFTNDNSLSRSNIVEAGSGITNIKQIMWWNNTNSRRQFWYAHYTCEASDMATYVITGSYTIYRDVNGRYTKLWQLSSNDAGSWSTWGGSTRRGYKGVANSSSNKAHVVMNFYRSR